MQQWKGEMMKQVEDKKCGVYVKSEEEEREKEASGKGDGRGGQRNQGWKAARW